jgi:hypothetical protein
MNSADTSIVLFNLNNNRRGPYFVLLTLGFARKLAIFYLTESEVLKFVVTVQISTAITIKLLPLLLIRMKKRRENPKKFLKDCANMGRGGEFDF